MALTLPEWLTDAFNIIGLPWPGIDEDTLHDWARSVRTFADDICDNSSQTNQSMRELADSSQSAVLGSLAQQYESHHQLLTELHGPMYDFAGALDVVADAVVVQKGAVITAATVLAGAVIATQGEALVTFGLAEAEVPLEVAAARMAVRLALQELEAIVMGKLVNWASSELSDVLGRSITGLASDAWGVTMEVKGLKIAYSQVQTAAERIRGQADKAEQIGSKAHSENTNRKLEDSSGGGGWHEVIRAVEQMLVQVAGDMFMGLPRTIAKVLRNILQKLQQLLARLRGADEAGGPAVAGGAAAAARLAPGEAAPGAGGDNRDPATASTRPGSSQPDSACTTAGDPVDVANGDVMMSETDVTLPGVLPLILGRSHRSSRQPGRWFGKSWMSSLDQRLIIAGERIIGAFDDGRLLTWELPGSPDNFPVIPEAGPLWALRRDEDDAYTVSDPQRGLTWRFEHRAGYEDELPLVSVTDRTGHEIAFSYDAAGRPLSVTHSGGYRVLVSVTDEHVTALTLAGRDGEDDIPLRTFEYGTDGNLSGVINSSGQPLRFAYDGSGRLAGWTDRNGHSYQYEFDDRGRCVRGESPSGALSGTSSYEEPGVTVWTDGAGADTRYRSDDPFGITSVVDPLGSETRTGRDSRGRVTTVTDPLGRVTGYEFDERGNLAAVTRPDGTRAQTQHDEHCRPVSVTEADGRVWRQSFDERGSLTELNAPDGAVVRYGYDSAGHLASVTGPDNRVTTVTCDPAGLPLAVTRPDGTQTCYARDQFGRVRLITAPDGSTTAMTWTIDGKPASRTFPDDTVENWEWDGEGNLVRHVSPAGAVTTHAYGPFDVPRETVWPDGTRSSFGYDHEQRVTSVSHGGLTWEYAYDPTGRLVTETDYNEAVTTYAYDAAGQMVRRVNAADQSVSYLHDAIGNVISSTADGAMTTFDYDVCGRLIRASNPTSTVEWQRDAAGRVTAETCDGRTVSTAYDAAGRVTGRVTPSGAQASWTYDTAGLPAVLSAGGQEMRFGYDRNGREISRGLPGGAALSQDWDPAGQLAGQVLTGAGSSGASVLQRRAYAYGPDGFVTGLDDLLTGTREFNLDPVGRVTHVTGPQWSERYSYDGAGNLTGAVWPAIPLELAGGWLGADVQGPRVVTGTLTRRAGNIRYRHDAAGRVVRRTRTRISRKPETWEYSWDADSRLVAVGTPDGSAWRYFYDPLGRRVAKQHVSAAGEVLAETWFAWDGTVLAEQASAGEVTTWDYRPRSFSLVAQTTSRERGNLLRDASQQEIDRRFYSIITDLAGTPSELVAADGTLAGHRQQTLWGGTAWNPSGASTPLRFPGQYADDETGFHYNNQRYYDPVTGSYLSPDPMGLTPAPNPHRYAANPHIGIDPLGLETCMRLSGKKSIEANQAAIDARETGHAFSGVHDPASGEFEAFPSGDEATDPVAVVPRRGGHAAINQAAFGNSRSTVAFTAIKQEDGSLNVTWLSRGVTGRNFPGSDNLANPEQQQAILRALQRATGRTVTG